MTERNTLTKITPLGPYPTLPVSANALDLTFTQADVAGDPINEKFVPAADNLLLVWNKHATDPATFTLNSVVDDKKRTGDITAYSVGAGEIAAYRIKKAGWMQTTGYVHLEASTADIWFCVLALQ